MLSKYSLWHFLLVIVSACTAAAHGGKLSSSVQIWQPPGLQCGVHEGQQTLSKDWGFIGIFVQLWYQYDTDGSGYIEADELKVDNLIMDLEVRVLF